MFKEDSNKFVTVFCDASYCPETGAAGWAGWVKYGSSGETLRCSGRLVGCPNSTEAEKNAIVETIKRALMLHIEFDRKVVIVQSDCLSALGALENNRVIERMLLSKGESADVIKHKHVKGHQGYRCRRSSVNTWCDKEARRKMREARNERV